MKLSSANHTITVTGVLTPSADSVSAHVPLPKDIFDSGEASIEGTTNGYPVRGMLKRCEDGQFIEMSQAILRAAGLQAGAPITLEITRVGNEPECRPPADLLAALSPDALDTWTKTTPNARRDWILFVTTSKQAETRNRRIERAADQLARGQKRVCCFGGLNWLTKANRAAETWVPLPKER